jgi:hypothetical protein
MRGGFFLDLVSSSSLFVITIYEITKNEYFVENAEDVEILLMLAPKILDIPLIAAFLFLGLRYRLGKEKV